jgi:hypothetical protein
MLAVARTGFRDGSLFGIILMHPDPNAAVVISTLSRAEESIQLSAALPRPEQSRSMPVPVGVFKGSENG